MTNVVFNAIMPLEVITMQSSADKKKYIRAVNKSISSEERRADELEQRQYNSLVVKSNVAIQKARYSLSLQQQKILCYLITELKDTDTKDTEKIFSIKAFYEFMEVGNKDYDKVRQALQGIRNKSWWVQDENGVDVLLSFFNTVRCDRRTSRVRIKWHEDMLPYLQNLRKMFTQYRLWYIMTMKSEYSIRLYELLKSVENKTLWEFSIDELKHKFMCENYTRFNDFKKRVIDTAVNEINAMTDITVSYELFKYGDSGRAYTHIEFTIETKSAEERIAIDHLIRDELDRNQLTIDDL